MTSKRDFYEVLGVEKAATDDDIKKAYRRLALQFHPDRNKEADAEAKFKEAKEAYEILSDAKKRRAYDQFGHRGVEGATAGTPGFEDFGFGSIFDAFESVFGASTRRGPQRGADMQYELQLTLEEAVFGVEKEIEIPRWIVCEPCGGSGAEPGSQPARCPECQGSGEIRRVQQTILGSFTAVQPCPRCHGEGKIITKPCPACHGRGRNRHIERLTVAVPPGVDSGQGLTHRGLGEAPQRGGTPGDLYVIFAIKPHKRFQRQGVDLYMDHSINVAEAALGCETSIEMLDGNLEPMKIPAGSQHGRVINLRGRGVPYLNRGGHGDLKIRLRVDVPTKLTDEQRRLFQELARTFGDGQNNHRDKDASGIFEKFKRGFKER